MRTQSLQSIALALFTSASLFAHEKVGSERISSASSGSAGMRVLANCSSPKASKELWLNNVRTIIYSGGDMWWDLNGNNNAYYYIPAVSNRNVGVSSSFAGSIWLGGLDAGGQLKVAAMTYRQNGIDFWPGPLDTTNASVNSEICSKYDEIFTISRAEVDNFVTNKVVTPNILNWPGNGDVSLGLGRRLAPFTDVNSDGLYDPTAGDYPAYDVENKAEKDNLGFCKTKLFGDYTLFWVFNDNGGIHTETQGVPIGVEVRAQAFAFKTNDEINNMTFYSYEIFNRSSFQLNNTYFTIWNDADLGYYLDDYVGCDVRRGMGYIYNADAYDETASGVNGYLDFPPALGCDFFKGPLADYDALTGKGDGIDNDQDGITDEVGETIQMSRFTYYNNNIGAFPPQTTNPDIAIHYYNYMTGKWKDGSFFTTGGNAYGGTLPSTFVYDGNPVAGTGWTEKGSGNLPGDRRFLQSAGPFTLKPGAVNEITFGMPWAQSPNKGGNIQSLELLFSADDKAQALFDNCFKLLDGPEAPDMTIQEMDGELIFYLTNQKGKSNNYKLYNNDYEEEDISILSDPTSNNPKLSNPDKKYRFEGYIVYQVKDDKVTSTDLSDPTKAVPVFQCDIENGKGRLINFEMDNNVGGYVPKIKVDGADAGIKSVFRISEDAFSASSNRSLINHKQYYFVSVAYAYNEYLPYAQDVPPSASSSANSLGQKKPYLEGRKIKRAAGTPHNTEAENFGTIVNGVFGSSPKITRIEGQGNGGNLLTLTEETEAKILNSSSGVVRELQYEAGQGPLDIKVVDPLNVKGSEFEFKFIRNRVSSKSPVDSINAYARNTGTNNATVKYNGILGSLNVDSTSWELYDKINKKYYYPNEIKTGEAFYQTVKVANEYIIPELGISISIKQTPDPSERVNAFTDFSLLTADSNYAGPKSGSFIGASLVYKDGESNWLNAIRDNDGESPLNWILSGTNKTDGFEDAFYKKDNENKIVAFYDPNKQYAKILNGTWAPYALCASYVALSANTTGNPARIFCGPGFNGKAWAQDDYLKQVYANQNTQSTPNNNNCDLRKLSSVLVVLTKDQSKWTRCPVLEMQEKSQLSENHAIYFSPRKHKSVDKNGKTEDDPGVVLADANVTSKTGMGWFPGYAINIETGERLNMAFGEDSYQKENRGNDMMWNPTSSLNSPFSYAMGGKHFIYVFSGNTMTGKFWENPTFPWSDTLKDKPNYVGRYDKAERLMYILNSFFSSTVLKSSGSMNGAGLAPFSAIEREIMWVSMPMVRSGKEFVNPSQMPSEVRIQINVSKPYRYGYSGVLDYTSVNQPYATFNKLVSANSKNSSEIKRYLTKDRDSLSSKNNNFPMYSFSTKDLATVTNNDSIAENALNRIKIVPNPYYGSSSYEQNRSDNRVRITNLPNMCTIKIFSMNGTLIRTIKRDVSGQENQYSGSTGGGDDIKKGKYLNYVEWDLKNQNNISVASGLYIFHIEAFKSDGKPLGEKILKWFGIMRPLDVQNY